jgi:hypothetical protein
MTAPGTAPTPVTTTVELARIAAETRSVYLAAAAAGDAHGRLRALDLLARITVLRQRVAARATDARGIAA